MTAQTFTHFRRLRHAAITTLALAALFAAPAESRVYYTSPDTKVTWPNCDTPENACEFRWLAEQYSGVGDTIVLLPGSYGTPADPIEDGISTKMITLTGQPGKPRPQLNFNYPDAGLTMCAGSLKHVDIRNKDLGAYEMQRCGGAHGTVEGVVAEGGRYGCLLTGDAILRNSVCKSTDQLGVAIEAQGSGYVDVRNVTAISSGPASYGLKAYTWSEPLTVDITNTILRGTSNDVQASSEGNVALKLRLGYSNFRAAGGNGDSVQVVEGPQGSNQSADPKFIDPAAGDYRQAFGSPTIDAGVVSAENGEFDLDGDKRTIGESTDIGADELAMTFRSGGSDSNPDPGSETNPDPGSETSTGEPTEPRSITIIDPEPALQFSGSLKRRSWRAARGTKLRVQLNGNADVRAQLRRRRGARLVKAGKLALGTLTAGTHVVRLRSPLPGGRKLRPGRYRLVLRATAGGARASSKPIRFRILAPRR